MPESVAEFKAQQREREQRREMKRLRKRARLLAKQPKLSLRSLDECLSACEEALELARKDPVLTDGERAKIMVSAVTIASRSLSGAAVEAKIKALEEQLSAD